MNKLCETCGKKILLPPSAIQEGRKRVRPHRRFCNRQCSGLSRKIRQPIRCGSCGKFYEHHQHDPNRKYCSNDCYLERHRIKQQACLTCRKMFRPPRRAYNAKYCAIACVPRKGPHNGNFGKRHPNMPGISAASRMKLSLERRGKGNPNYTGGKTPYRYRHQQAILLWGRKYHGRCLVCPATGITMHHVIPRRLFLDVVMSNFSQNLVALCRSHHSKYEQLVRNAIKERRFRDIPFSDRTPESIFRQLEKDGSVCRISRECDFSPLGIVAALAIRPEFYS